MRQRSPQPRVGKGEEKFRVTYSLFCVDVLVLIWLNSSSVFQTASSVLHGKEIFFHNATHTLCLINRGRFGLTISHAARTCTVFWIRISPLLKYGAFQS